MDINKYIGKFLLKNKYCSLPGLGVFELSKENAKVSSNAEGISAPSYKISFTPVGSIDDTFASFIASAENVSISNASNNIREYCKAVKDEITKTGKYEIEFLGKWSMSGNKMVFHQSADLDLGAEPLPLSPLQDKPKSPEVIAAKPDYSYPPAYRNKKDMSWLKIALPILTLVLLSTAAYFGYDYYQKNKAAEQLVAPEETQVDTLVLPTDTINKDTIQQVNTSTDSSAMQDTMSQQVSTSAPVIQNGTNYNVVILSFDNEAAASAKAKKLKNYGNNTSVVASNGRFQVVIQASQPQNDTARLVDSLRRFFNPKGPVFILK